jgi:hypothetical protein
VIRVGDQVRGLGGAFGAVRRAIRVRPALFLGVAVAVILFDFFLPLIVLSVFQKPWNYFSFNPWLPNLPGWLASPQATLARKIQFVSHLSLLWFIANNSYGEPDWGVWVGVSDVVQWLYMGVLFGAYVALWVYAGGGAVRRPVALRRNGAAVGRRGEGAVALVSTLGLVISPCGMVGCGLLMFSLLGFVVHGATFGTLTALAAVSHILTVVVLIAMTLTVAAMGWMVAKFAKRG